jgi:hypothetical protein
VYRSKSGEDDDGEQSAAQDHTPQDG